MTKKEINVVDEAIGIIVMIVGAVVCYYVMVVNAEISAVNTGLLFVILGHSILESSRR